METKREPMRELEPKQGVYAAHFDVLGMSNLLSRSTSRAWLILCDLAKASDENELPISEESRQGLVERFFSDTIVIRTNDDSSGSLHTILARCFELFRCAFRSGIPIRGGVAHGTWIESSTGRQDLFTGTALSEAYRVGETQQMLSVAVCKNTQKAFSKIPFTLREGAPALVSYNVPLKRGSEQRDALNWPAISELELGQNNEPTTKEIADRFTEFGKFEDLDKKSKQKYINTAEFIKSVLAS